MTTTLRDVAEKANVSLTTASKVLNRKAGDIRISKATEKRVFEIASELNYTPNILAKGLRSGKTSLVGVILSDLKNSNQGQLYQGTADYLVKKGYCALLYTTGFDAEREKLALDFFLEKKVEGICLTSTLYCHRESLKGIMDLEARGVKIVLNGEKKVEGIRSPFVGYDDRAVGYIAARHLLNLGHSRILCLANTANNNLVGILRMEGYKNALTEAGIEIDDSLIPRFERGMDTYELAGYRATKQFLESGGKCSAVFAHCDTAALGVISAVRDFGLRVPDDIAVVGADDEDFAAYVDPPLTTVSLKNYALGQAMASTLCRMLEGKEAASDLWVPELVTRESCGSKAGTERNLLLSRIG